MPFLMQACSSTTGAVVTWVTASADWAGASFPGPGLPQYISVLSQPAASAFARRTPEDANTLLAWRLDELAAPFVSTGSNALALTVTGSAGVSIGAVGFFGQSVRLIPALSSSAMLTTPSTIVQPPLTAFTLSAWVRALSFPSGAWILGKGYRSGAWANPWLSLALTLQSGTDGAWQFQYSAGYGLDYSTSVPAAFKIPLGAWTFLAVTYDGTSYRCYLNGVLAWTGAAAAPFSFGEGGPWVVGNSPGTGQGWDGWIDDVRVDSIVRSDRYIDAMYKSAIGLYE